MNLKFCLVDVASDCYGSVLGLATISVFFGSKSDVLASLMTPLSNTVSMCSCSRYTHRMYWLSSSRKHILSERPSSSFVIRNTPNVSILPAWVRGPQNSGRCIHIPIDVVNTRAQSGIFQYLIPSVALNFVFESGQDNSSAYVRGLTIIRACFIRSPICCQIC